MFNILTVDILKEWKKIISSKIGKNANWQTDLEMTTINLILVLDCFVPMDFLVVNQSHETKWKKK